MLFLQHFRGNVDNWDPLLVDTIAGHREVILLDNTGVGLSSGVVPRTVTEMARDAIYFCDGLELTEIDLLGYSLGGMVAQDLALLRPRLVRRLVLAGTGPRGGGQLMHGWAPDVARIAKSNENGPDEYLWLFFEHTDTSRELGRAYYARLGERRENRDAPTTDELKEAQYDAIVEWGIPDKSQLNRLAGIRSRAGGQRRQRHDDPDDQQPHPRGAPAQCQGADLPRRRSRLPLPMAGRIRRRGREPSSTHD